MSIHVTDFKWEKGNNDLQYIELLEKTLKNEQAITAKAVAKIRELSIENSELYNEAQAERAFLTERDAEIQAKAIDEFAERLKNQLQNWSETNYVLGQKGDDEAWGRSKAYDNAIDLIDEIAEEMRGAE